MTSQNPDHSSMSDPTLLAEIASDTTDLTRREFFKSMGERTKYVAPTLMVLTLSRQSLAQEISEPPPLPERYQPYRQQEP